MAFVTELILLTVVFIQFTDHLAVRDVEYTCRMEEFNGFLKETCRYNVPFDIVLMRCPYSNAGYKVFEPVYSLSSLPFFNASCPNDTLGYQVCGLVEKKEWREVLVSSSWSLCGLLPCMPKNSERTVAAFTREKICRDPCKNHNQDQRDSLACNDSELSPLTKKCDFICDTSNCVDEHDCNGYQYAIQCVDDRIIPPTKICDGEFDCTNRDERMCDIKPDTPTCIQRAVLWIKGVQKTVPIFNFIRCSAITISPALYADFYWIYGVHMKTVMEEGISYCTDYMDQTNCSDPSRVAISCVVPSHGYSTISKVMVCRKIRKNMCVDGMDVACVEVVSGQCTLHKHQLCDQIHDCVGGEDESHSVCQLLTKERCYRNYRTGKQLPIPAAWLGDGMLDCLNNQDENWHIKCGRGDRSRFEVDENCQDVFLCRYGEVRFRGLGELCNGEERCNGEKAVCVAGRGLSSMSTAVSYSEQDNTWTLDHCVKGLEDLHLKLGVCVVKIFNWFKEQVYGMGLRTAVLAPSAPTDCRFTFGEAYVFKSCLGGCTNSPCPLTRPVKFHDCPGQYKNRIYTVVNNQYITFLQRKAKYYHNNFFHCKNGRCTEFDKVCNLWNDCGDSSDEENCTNSFKCEDQQGIILLSKKCDGIADCSDMSDECNTECGKEIINGYPLKCAAWTIGLLAIVSNCFILGYHVKGLWGCKTKSLNDVLIILIGVGDFLVGLYLFCLAIIDSIKVGGDYCKQQFGWITTDSCSFLGVISTLGSQISLFSLTLLSIVRALEISKNRLTPKTDNSPRMAAFKLTVLIVIVVGTTTIIAVISLLPFLSDFFVNGLVYDSSVRIFQGRIGKERNLRVIQSYYGRSKRMLLKWDVIENLIKAMFSADYKNLDGKIARIHFYGNDGVCLFKYFVTKEDPQWIFTIIILSINIACFAIVAVAYICINVSTITVSRPLTKIAGPTANMVTKRNQRLQRKIGAIITTDFLCWVPFVTVCLLHFFEVLDATPQYGLFSIVILPINSVINPFLYSTALHNILTSATNCIWRKLKRAKEGEGSIPRQHKIEMRDLTESKNVSENNKMSDIIEFPSNNNNKALN